MDLYLDLDLFFFLRVDLYLDLDLHFLKVLDLYLDLKIGGFGFENYKSTNPHKKKIMEILKSFLHSNFKSGFVDLDLNLRIWIWIWI